MQRSHLQCSPYPCNAARSTQEERRALFLERAVTCAILASAGPQRSRMLATLYKDDRTHKLPVFGVLKKMYVGALCRRVCVLDCSLVPVTGRCMHCALV
jgi:COP9 signalosome complex subunit 4